MIKCHNNLNEFVNDVTATCATAPRDVMIIINQNAMVIPNTEKGIALILQAMTAAIEEGGEVYNG